MLDMTPSLDVKSMPIKAKTPAFEADFFVYKPDSKFKKTDPGVPYFKVVVQR